MFNIFSIPTAYAQTARTVAADKSSETLSFIQSAIEFLWLQVPRWVAAIILFAVTFLVAKMVKNMVESKMAEKGIEEEHQEISILAGRVAHAVTLMIGITVALKVAGIDLTAILAAVAFGIGFALRDLIMNFLAGAMILISRQFTIGDMIKVNDTVGKIVEIQSRATILKALDGTKIIVPNAELFTNQVINFTGNPFRRIELAIGVEYDTNLPIAIETVDQALKSTPGILLEPKSTIIFEEFGDSSINLSVRFWVESRGGWLGVRSQAIQNIKQAFDKVGIGIPFPIRTIYQAQSRDIETFQAEQEKNYQSFPKKQPTTPAPTTESPQPAPETPAQAPTVPPTQPPVSTTPIPVSPEQPTTTNTETPPAEQQPIQPSPEATTAAPQTFELPTQPQENQ